jgi:hypothetical protein
MSASIARYSLAAERGLRLDRRTTFDGRFWLVAAARLGAIRGLTREALFENREVFGILRRAHWQLRQAPLERLPLRLPAP